MRGRVIILKDGQQITEKKTAVQGIQVYGYYFKGDFIFGTEAPWTQESLQQLYDNGYFDPWKEKTVKDSLKRAQQKYCKKCKIFTIRINRETESDILDWIAQPGAGSRIKKLIREDIQRRGE